MTIDEELVIEPIDYSNDEFREILFKGEKRMILAMLAFLSSICVMMIIHKEYGILIAITILMMVILIIHFLFVRYLKSKFPVNVVIGFNKEGIFYRGKENNKVMTSLKKEKLTLICLRPKGLLEIGLTDNTTHLDLATFEHPTYKITDLGEEIISFCSKVFPEITVTDPHDKERDGTKI